MFDCFIVFLTCMLPWCNVPYFHNVSLWTIFHSVRWFGALHSNDYHHIYFPGCHVLCVSLFLSYVLPLWRGPNIRGTSFKPRQSSSDPPRGDSTVSSLSSNDQSKRIDLTRKFKNVTWEVTTSWITLNQKLLLPTFLVERWEFLPNRITCL